MLHMWVACHMWSRKLEWSRTVPVLSGARRKSRWLHENNNNNKKMFTDPFREQIGKIHSTGTREIPVTNKLSISQHNSK